jgi:AcrR family transcriptional regulator
MPRRKEEFAKIREQSKSHLLQVALSLFAEHGFDGTSMAMIAKKAGVSTGLAYNYFKSKEDLLKELFASTIENLSNVLGPQVQSPSKEDCIQTMRNLASSVKTQTDLWRLMVQIMLQPEMANRLLSGLTSMPGNPLITFKRYFEAHKDTAADSKANAVTAIVIGVVLFYLTHENEAGMNGAFDLISKNLL